MQTLWCFLKAKLPRGIAYQPAARQTERRRGNRRDGDCAAAASAFIRLDSHPLLCAYTPSVAAPRQKHAQQAGSRKIASRRLYGCGWVQQEQAGLRVPIAGCCLSLAFCARSSPCSLDLMLLLQLWFYPFMESRSASFTRHFIYRVTKSPGLVCCAVEPVLPAQFDTYWHFT